MVVPNMPRSSSGRTCGHEVAANNAGASAIHCVTASETGACELNSANNFWEQSGKMPWVNLISVRCRM